MVPHVSLTLLLNSLTLLLNTHLLSSPYTLFYTPLSLPHPICPCLIQPRRTPPPSPPPVITLPLLPRLGSHCRPLPHHLQPYLSHRRPPPSHCSLTRAASHCRPLSTIFGRGWTTGCQIQLDPASSKWPAVGSSQIGTADDHGGLCHRRRRWGHITGRYGHLAGSEAEGAHKMCGETATSLQQGKTLSLLSLFCVMWS